MTETNIEKQKALDHETLLSLVDYNPETGVFTSRVARKTLKPGGTCGCATREGYIKMGINGTPYYSHRLAWFYVHGEWPEHSIDHANGNKSDNRLENLRVASHNDNNRNRCLTKPPKSGFKGVHWFPRTKRWRARISVNHKLVELGYFLDPCEAHKAYCEAAKRLHGEFAKFE